MSLIAKSVTSFGKKECHLNNTKSIANQNIFSESVFSIIKNYKKTGDPSPYEPVIVFLRQKPPPSKLCCDWLSQLRDSIPLLDRNTERIILDTLTIPWQFGDEAIETHFHNFIVSLITGHNYFVSPILEFLFVSMKPVINQKNSEELKCNPLLLSSDQQSANYKTIQLIKKILHHVPLCQNVLLKIAKNTCPYFKQHVHIHTVFTYNMLQLSLMMPHLRKPLLEIILSNIIKMDLHSPKQELDQDSDSESDNESEDLFNMEVEGETPPSRIPRTKHPVGHSLDIVLLVFFRYIHLVCHGGKSLKAILETPVGNKFEVNGCQGGSVSSSATDDAGESVRATGCECQGKNHDLTCLKELYLDLKMMFQKLILPTHNTVHSQYVIFYVLSLRPSLVSDFLDFLKNIFESSSASSREERKSSIAYFGSLLVRGMFVKFSHVHYCLEILYAWCKSYLQSEYVKTHTYEDIQSHHHFYCACQTLFYVFTFNYKEYTSSKARLKMAQSLHLNELVSSPLNPLRFCNPTIVTNFAAVTSHYQLAYCYSVLESNMRLFLPVAMRNSYGMYNAESNSLDMFFPFDPFLLRGSETFIRGHYKEFEGLPDEILRHSTSMSASKNKDLVDQDVDDENFMWNSPASMKFSYEMSPCFK